MAKSHDLISLFGFGSSAKRQKVLLLMPTYPEKSLYWYSIFCIKPVN